MPRKPDGESNPPITELKDVADKCASVDLAREAVAQAQESQEVRMRVRNLVTSDELEALIGYMKTHLGNKADNINLSLAGRIAVSLEFLAAGYRLRGVEDLGVVTHLQLLKEFSSQLPLPERDI